MEKEREKLIKALMAFVKRAAKGKTTSEKEIEVLPDVVNSITTMMKEFFM